MIVKTVWSSHKGGSSNFEIFLIDLEFTLIFFSFFKVYLPLHDPWLKCPPKALPLLNVLEHTLH